MPAWRTYGFGQLKVRSASSSPQCSSCSGGWENSSALPLTPNQMPNKRIEACIQQVAAARSLKPHESSKAHQPPVNYTRHQGSHCLLICPFKACCQGSDAHMSLPAHKTSSSPSPPPPPPPHPKGTLSLKKHVLARLAGNLLQLPMVTVFITWHLSVN